MSSTTFGKWYWSDWMSDPGVRASSYAARGLWMDLLCIAAQADPTGYVVLNGRPLTASEIARLTGGHASEVEILLDELARNGVFTRDRNGKIYSRRMLREKKKAKTATENGKLGGNPTLRKQRDNSASDNPGDNHEDNGRLKTQKPDTRNQKEADASLARETRMRIAEAFKDLAPKRLVPDTNRVVVWLHQGFDPDLIVAVVREILPRKPDVGSLSYFDRPLADAKAAKTSAVAAAGGGDDPKVDIGNGCNWPRSSVVKVIDLWVQDHTKWPEAALGPPPGSPGCRIPPELLPASVH